jgi:hypothetical protein
MKKIVVILALVIVSSLTLLSLVGIVGANPHPEPGFPEISLSYSVDLGSNTITLKTNISMLQDTDPCNRQAWYSLDGQKNVSISLTYKGTSYWGIYHFSEVTGETKMPMWSNGPHTLTVIVVYDYGDLIRAENKTLYIGQPEPTPTPPVLTIISPQDQATYNTAEVQIIYTLNLKVAWSYYALDPVGEPETSDWKPFTGNITLSGLTEGSHKLVISVKAETAYVPAFTEKSINFKVNSTNQISTSSAIPTPTAPEYSLIILPIIMGATMCLIFVLRNKLKLKKVNDWLR